MNRSTVLIAIMAVFGITVSHAAQPTANALEERCQAIAGADFSDIADAPTQVTASSFVGPQAVATPYCKVEGYVSPQVGFELRLPATWNKKFLEVGCGGWCGSINATACDAPLTRGYACIATDMGHKGTGMDVLWAHNNLQTQIDFGYRATHVVAVAGKAIAQHFYDVRPRRSYFAGCSTGGYQGVTAAQRFPWDFDGIVAGAPDIDGAAASLRVTWIVRTFLDESGKRRLSENDLQLVHEAVLKRCDMDDGVRDGIVGNPLACKFQPEDLVCKHNERDRCLTPSSVKTVRQLYAGPTTTEGQAISTGGFLPGSELMWSQFWPVSSLEQFYKYAIPGYTIHDDWRYTDFDFDVDYKRLGLAAYYDNSNPDLRRFKQAGGKMILYHGGNDTINLPGAVTDYYEAVERTMGGRAATQDTVRLFMIPGMNHCSGGKGAYAVDWLSLLEAWVEEGTPPDGAVSARVSDEYLATTPLARASEDMSLETRIAIAAYSLRYPLDSSIPLSFTRPIYPYPDFAVYRGEGDPNDAKNFTRSRPSP